MVSTEEISGSIKGERQMESVAAELEASNAELRSFAYIISHDLRAPLVNIKGFSGELNSSMEELSTLFGAHAERFPQKERARIAEIFGQDVPESLDFINSSVERMDRLINAILKLSRLGHRELKGERVDLREMVEGILKTMSHQLEERRALVCVGELPELCADRIALEQVVGNLLDNAVKYLDPSRPGKLEVQGEDGPEGVVIHVTDNGRGIAQEDLTKIFDIFRRAGRQDVKGEGMGLAYVKALVRKLHGQIWCTSELGAGSTFSFSIPRFEIGPDGGAAVEPEIDNRETPGEARRS